MKKSAALGYNKDRDTAPVLLAKGQGKTAELINRLAAERGIPLLKQVGLTDMLLSLDLGETIPEELYEMVAEIIAFVYQLRSAHEQV